MAFYENPHAPQCPWYPYAETYGAPNIKWCEETLCQWISEPANTWSNLGYILVAFYIFYRAKKSGKSELLWFGPAMFLQGLFSLTYHASNFYISQIFDFVGMYFFVYWFWILNSFRAGWIGRKALYPTLAIASIASTALLHWMYLTGVRFQGIIAAAVMIILVSEFFANKRSRKLGLAPIRYGHFAFGLLFVGAAFTFSVLDGSGTWCDPSDHIIQGHALWHVLASIGLTFATIHYEQFDYSKFKK